MRSPESNPGRPIVVNVILAASAAVTADGNGAAVTLDGFEMLLFQLEVTAAATTSGDKLDVYIQTTVDGATWLDALRFTQVLGNGGAKRCLAKLSASLALTEFETGTALAAASQRTLIGSQWRVRWAVTTASAPSFTFSVTANAT